MITPSDRTAQTYSYFQMPEGYTIMIDFMQDFLTVVAFIAVIIAMIAFIVEVYDRVRTPGDDA